MPAGQISHWPRLLLREAREATSGRPQRRLDLVAVAAIGTAAGLGGAFGSLIGPGRSPQRVA